MQLQLNGHHGVFIVILSPFRIPTAIIDVSKEVRSSNLVVLML
jgi:hypothetical protein